MLVCFEEKIWKDYEFMLENIPNEDGERVKVVSERDTEQRKCERWNRSSAKYLRGRETKKTSLEIFKYLENIN